MRIFEPGGVEPFGLERRVMNCDVPAVVDCVVRDGGLESKKCGHGVLVGGQGKVSLGASAIRPLSAFRMDAPPGNGAEKLHKQVSVY